jgi:hypothetical protein
MCSGASRRGRFSGIPTLAFSSNSKPSSAGRAGTPRGRVTQSPIDELILVLRCRAQGRTACGVADSIGRLLQPHCWSVLLALAPPPSQPGGSSLATGQIRSCGCLAPPRELTSKPAAQVLLSPVATACFRPNARASFTFFCFLLAYSTNFDQRVVFDFMNLSCGRRSPGA